MDNFFPQVLFSLQAIAIAPYYKDHRMMEQAVKKGGDLDLIFEDFSPARKIHIRGDDYGQAFIGFTDQAKEYVSLLMKHYPEKERFIEKILLLLDYELLAYVSTWIGVIPLPASSLSQSRLKQFLQQ